MTKKKILSIALIAMFIYFLSSVVFYLLAEKIDFKCFAPLFGHCLFNQIIAFVMAVALALLICFTKFSSIRLPYIIAVLVAYIYIFHFHSVPSIVAYIFPEHQKETNTFIVVLYKVYNKLYLTDILIAFPALALISRRIYYYKSKFKDDLNSFIDDFRRKGIKEDVKSLNLWLEDERTEDKLNRNYLAVKIADEICSIKNEKSSFTFGINGDWGNGKTFFLDLIKKELKKSPDIIQLTFDPWKYETNGGYYKYFIEKLCIEKNLSLNLKIKKYFEKLSHIESKGIFSFFGSLVNTDLNTLEKEIKETLVNEEHRIVVFIDDLDRLTQTEVLEIFKLIRNGANLPYFFFVIAYDKNTVTKQLKDQSFNYSYLEKIVQVEIDLPLYKPGKIESVFKRFEEFKIEPSKIKHILTTLSYNDVHENFYAYTTFENILNIRQLNRIYNRMNLIFRKLIDEEEIDAMNLFIIEILRLIDYDTYLKFINREILTLEPFGRIYRYILREDEETKKLKSASIYLLKNILTEGLKRNSVAIPEIHTRLVLYDLELPYSKFIKDMENFFPDKVLEEYISYKEEILYLANTFPKFSGRNIYLRYFDLLYVLSKHSDIPSSYHDKIFESLVLNIIEVVNKDIPTEKNVVEAVYQYTYKDYRCLPFLLKIKRHKEIVMNIRETDGRGISSLLDVHANLIYFCNYDNKKKLWTIDKNYKDKIRDYLVKNNKWMYFFWIDAERRIKVNKIAYTLIYSSDNKWSDFKENFKKDFEKIKRIAIKYKLGESGLDSYVGISMDDDIKTNDSSKIIPEHLIDEDYEFLIQSDDAWFKETPNYPLIFDFPVKDDLL